MNAQTTVSVDRAVVWPDPVVNSVPGALNDAFCLIERLSALLASNTADFYEALVEPSAAGSDWMRSRAESIGMIYTLAGEKLHEVERLIGEITERVHINPQTGVGKHVIRARHSAWVDVVTEYKVAEAVPLTGGGNDAAICDAAADAFKRMIGTRAPDLRALHEKMCITQTTGGFQTDGVIDALFADVEHLVHLYERNGQPAAPAEG